MRSRTVAICTNPRPRKRAGRSRALSTVCPAGRALRLRRGRERRKDCRTGPSPAAGGPARTARRNRAVRCGPFRPARQQARKTAVSSARRKTHRPERLPSCLRRSGMAPGCRLRKHKCRVGIGTPKKTPRVPGRQERRTRRPGGPEVPQAECAPQRRSPGRLWAGREQELSNTPRKASPGVGCRTVTWRVEPWRRGRGPATRVHRQAGPLPVRCLPAVPAPRYPVPVPVLRARALPMHPLGEKLRPRAEVLGKRDGHRRAPAYRRRWTGLQRQGKVRASSGPLRRAMFPRGARPGRKPRGRKMPESPQLNRPA